MVMTAYLGVSAETGTRMPVSVPLAEKKQRSEWCTNELCAELGAVSPP